MKAFDRVGACGSYCLAVIETAGHPSRAHRASAALVLAGISLVLLLASCAGAALILVSNDRDPLPVQSKPQIASASQVEAVAHVTLPPGTILLSAAYSNGLETRLSAKFRIPRTQLDAFVTAARFNAAPTPGLLLDLDVPDVATIYLYTSGG